MCGSDIFLGLIAILFPPVAVWVKKGLCGADSLINIALCCLGFFPGLLHAWYIIASTPDPTYEQVPQDDPERAQQGGNVTYYYVQGQPRYAPQSGHRGYGAVNSTPDAQFPQRQQGFVQPVAAQSQAGGSTETPPSYQQATSGDNKIQRP